MNVDIDHALTMPLLKLETTVVLPEDKHKTLLASPSKSVAETIRKPEQYVMVTLGQAISRPAGQWPASYSTWTWRIDDSHLQRMRLAVLSLENAPRNASCLANYFSCGVRQGQRRKHRA